MGIEPIRSDLFTNIIRYLSRGGRLRLKKVKEFEYLLSPVDYFDCPCEIVL